MIFVLDFSPDPALIHDRLKKWRAWGDSNARPLVPEFSRKLLSCWFALPLALA